MAHLFKISEAASLALHAMVLMAERPEKLFSVRDIARKLKVSKAHLSKVLQRLGRAGLVRSIRGPSGGFTLEKKSNRITLLDVYEAMEGRYETSSCLFGNPVCGRKNCILGGLLGKVDKDVRTYLASNRLSDLVGVYTR